MRKRRCKWRKREKMKMKVHEVHENIMILLVDEREQGDRETGSEEVLLPEKENKIHCWFPEHMKTTNKQTGEWDESAGKWVTYYTFDCPLTLHPSSPSSSSGWSPKTLNDKDMNLMMIAMMMMIMMIKKQDSWGGRCLTFPLFPSVLISSLFFVDCNLFFLL